ncbi:MAG TPA: GIY-YIG nuclease family protein [Alphaproteobacteria bacterium]|nr:GIY-YIG nuclease family protein [Alphaproteobacteria bacterium]
MRCAYFRRKVLDGGYAYILASERNGTLYVGVTSDLVRRVWEHREGAIPGFTSKYGVKFLVWYERHDEIETAILREKAIKKWRRAWKLSLIEGTNPDWQDLYEMLTGFPLSRE